MPTAEAGRLAKAAVAEALEIDANLAPPAKRWAGLIPWGVAAVALAIGATLAVRGVDEASALFRLLRHYAEAGVADREAWQDRVMSLDDLGPRELSRLHGELIAAGWVEQNTGVTPVVKRGIAAACYRITSPGLRTYRKACERESVDA